MISRCHNPKDKDFPNYGGRGISVCDRWQSFNVFIADMGPKPEGMSLDRIDVNGDYCPENCRWASALQQGRNKRNNRWVTILGERYIVAEAARLFGIPETTLSRWHKEGRNLDSLARTRNKRIYYDGKTMTLPEWSKHTGVPYTRLKWRLNVAGWAVERALTP